MRQFFFLLFASSTVIWTSCRSGQSEGVATGSTDSMAVIQPVIISDSVRFDTDDPAIWINTSDTAQSLVLGTDKNEDGAVYVFDLEGKVQESKVVRGLKRPNNIDVAYGLNLGGHKTDIAVVTEREANKIRVFSLPEMKAIDNGGISVFDGETERAPMGIALYTRPTDQAIFAIVSRKSGPEEGYLWTYQLRGDDQGTVKGLVVRKFGKYSGKKEIESIAVDDDLGYVYYSDEQVGVRKYYAHPDSSNQELALFANTGFTEDNEGISIYKTDATTGYILVSDQGADKFHIYKREGTADNPHQHQLVKTVKVAAHKSDGSEVTNIPFLPKFKRGVFVVMSEGKVFHYYRWEDIMP
ncbi:phytase [Dyadobacter tibetensis]|uniref:phytase n=1 Tax=Dyadobacter tibetensis TaxID=1211851 RepID=UPI00046F017F|nr:phytase [Dyadobacter tibetensis]